MNPPTIENLMEIVERYAEARDGKSQQWLIDARRTDIMAGLLAMMRAVNTPVQLNVQKGSTLVLTFDGVMPNGVRDRLQALAKEKTRLDTLILSGGLRLGGVLTPGQAAESPESFGGTAG